MAKAESKKTADLVTVTPNKAKTLIKVCMDSGRPIMLWGAPGIGKSDLVEAIATSYAKPRKVIDMRLLLLDPTDLRGIPYFNSIDNRMEFSKPSDLPEVVTQAMIDEAKVVLAKKKEILEKYTAGSDYNHIQSASIETEIEKAQRRVNRLVGQFEFQDAILFLDEMTSAPQSVQGAAYQLILNRRIGEYRLPDGISMIAAGNRESDRGVVHPMPKPLQNRFVHLNMDTSFEDWQAWGVTNGVSADVVGFLSAHPQHLFEFDPKSASKAFPTPRSWKFVSDLISNNHQLSIDALHPLISGTVGDGVAFKFLQHLKIASKMPSPQAVLRGQEKKMKIDEISAKYSLTIGMCYVLKEWITIAKNNEQHKTVGKGEMDFGIDLWHNYFDNFLKFMMDNFEDEMCVLGAKTAIRDYALPLQLDKLKEMDTFYDKFGKLILAV